MPGTRIGRRGRWTLVAVAATLSGIAGAACAPAGAPVNLPVEAARADLTVQVVDQLNDVGRMPSIAITNQGQAVVAYLLYQQVLKPGVLPAPIVPGTPQPPSVVLALQTGGVWTRTAVTGLAALSEKAVGKAPEIANKNFQAIPGVNTGLAVDAQGKDHVIWSTPSGLFYSDNTGAGGGFSAREQISKASVTGGAIAIGADGTMWVSYVEGSAVKAATRSGTSWKAERVATTIGASGLPAARTSIQVGSSGPVIAYGDNGTTVVATRSGRHWTTTNVPGQGGFAVSLAVDKSGNPHVSSYAASGDVIVADGSGGSFTTATIGHTSPGTSGQGNGSWSTGIAVDDRGTRYVVFANTKAHDIALAVNSGSGFRVKAVQDSTLGANPSLSVDPQGGILGIAWYDTVNQNLDTAITSAGGVVLAFSPRPQSPLPGPSASAATCKPSGTTITVVAKNTAFDKNCLAAPANTAFTVDFNNQDSGTPHNFDIYTKAPTDGGTHLAGATGLVDVLTGPASTTYNVSPLKAGTYYFQCDVHPTVMFGTFVVAT